MAAAVAVLAVAGCGTGSDGSTAASSVRPRSTTAPSTTVAAPAPAMPTIAPTTAVTTTAAPTTATATTVPAVASTAATSPDDPRIEPFRGFGTWLDAYEWSPTVTKGRPAASPDDVDAMADAGVRTLYLQSTLGSSDVDIVDPEVFRKFVDTAHGRGMKVVGWYLPGLVDLDRDVRRFQALADAGVDGLAVDIEGDAIADFTRRNARLVELSARLQRQFANRFGVAAVVLSPLALEKFKPQFWPNFPWQELAPYYDVWMPMGYWTFRRSETPEWDDGYRYTAGNFELLRTLTGLAHPLIHTIGGLTSDLRAGQAAEMVRAVEDNGGIGASLYTWVGLNDTDAAALRGLNPP